MSKAEKALDEIVKIFYPKVKRTKNKKATMAEKREFYGQLVYVQERNGFEKSWLIHQYMDKFHVLPHYTLQQQEKIKPTAATMAWLIESHKQFANFHRLGRFSEDANKG